MYLSYDSKEKRFASKDEIIRLMVGREIDASNLKTDDYIQDEVLLEVKNLTGKYKPTITDVSFDLKKGEILGVAGLVGSRRTELVETIFGLRQKESGQIFIHANEGKSVIFISSEMAELQMVCNRIMVMSNGRLAGIEKNDENLTQEKIMALQAKYV